MTRSLGDSLRGLQLAVQIRQTQTLLRGPEDWERFTTILSQMAARHAAEDKDFAHGFRARLETARGVVAREHLGLRPDQPLRDQDWSDRIPDPLAREAEARVYSDHLKRRLMHEEDALDALKDLRAALRARDAPTTSQQTRHDPSPDGSPHRSGPRR